MKETFYDLDRKEKRIVAALIAALSFLFLSALFGMNEIMSAENKLLGFVAALGKLWYLKLAIAFILVFVLVYLQNTSLDVAARNVGHGQHGKAAYMTPEEERKTYAHIPFGAEKKPGIVLGETAKNEWVIDHSDHNLLLLAPPGGGKTTRVLVEGIWYNACVNENTAGQGASMIVTDVKGDLYRTCNGFLQEKGYRTVCLDFRQLWRSEHYQLMYRVNAAMDKYLAATDSSDKAVFYGQAERHAKVLATSLVDNIDSGAKSEASDYFNETSKGLLTGVILMVSEYAAEDERHIISVFSIILEMNGQTQNMTMRPGAPQKTKLEELLEYIENRRIRNYTGAATGADMRTSMNVFSSALSKLTKFIDAELEQILCDHSPALSDSDFVADPTAIFIICPDENTTRHFFASLFIRFFCNDLIERAETEHNGVLPRQVIIFEDEFGNQPPIQDVDVLFAAVRSRNVRILISIQSYAQLNKSYSKEKAEIIKDTCQMVMTGFVAPSSVNTAENISKMLGNETVMTGSVTRGRDVSTTSSMVGRPLESPSDLTTMPMGTYIVMKGGYKPIKTTCKHYSAFLPIKPAERPVPTRLRVKEIRVASSESIRDAARKNPIILYKGMFDE